jgi:hypothetical protein
VEQLQVPKEEAVMEIIGIPEGQCGDQWWTVGPWNSLNEWFTCIIVQGTPKGRKFGKRRRVQQKCNSGIRDQGVNQQLLQETKCQRDRHTASSAEDHYARIQIITGHCGGVRDVGAPASLGSFAPQKNKGKRYT